MTTPRSARLLFVVLCSTSCAADAACEAPSALGYTCDAVAPAADACDGGPTIDGFPRDPDAYFPVGCWAGFSQCVDGVVQISHRCECAPTGSGAAPAWIGPL